MTALLTYDINDNRDVNYMHGIIEEYVQVSGFQVTLFSLQNRTIDTPAAGTPGDEYSVDQEIVDPNQADPLFGEMRKRNYDTGTKIWCLPDRLERENYLEKFGLVSQDTITLHFAINSMDIALSRKIMAGDIIELPNTIESRKYEVQDTMRSDYELYASYLWKVTMAPAHTSQDIVPISVTDLSYGSEVLSNAAVENIGDSTAVKSGVDYLDQIN